MLALEDRYRPFSSNVPHNMRLLATDNPLLLPVNTVIRVFITSSDVIHSWAIPALGIKIDACPGRINEVVFTVYRLGTLYGQCSEICGENHAFMPIEILVFALPD